jgi:EAL domain-containing protein (putative c-di-GMP-specific phosphodiesterase class I)
LKLAVVAEGVETQEQLNFLRSLRCDHVQGYFFSKPLRAGEVARLLDNARPLNQAS